MSKYFCKDSPPPPQLERQSPYQNQIAKKQPFSYLGMRTVLEHLDPNTRFKLYQNCPQIRATEKAVPLKIPTLYLEPLAFSMNDTKYKVGVIRVPEGRMTFDMWHVNITGGFTFELDRYNLQVRQKRLVPGPNEVFLGAYEFETDEQRIKREESIKDFIRGCHHKIMELRAEVPIFWKGIEELQKRANPNPRKDYLRLTIETREDIRSQRGESFVSCQGQTLPDALKYVFWKFFDGRSAPIQVLTLAVKPDGLIRLPLNLKLRVRDLQILGGNSKTLNSIFDYVNQGHPSLRSIEVQGSAPVAHPLISSANILIRKCNPQDLKLDETHPRIHFRHFLDELDYVKNLLKKWLETGKSGVSHNYAAGTCYSFQISHSAHKHVLALFEVMKKIPGSRSLAKIEPFPPRTILPMDPFLEIHVYCQMMFPEQNWVLIVELFGV